ncbi:MAG: acylneuraminate cytidylyltransferase family protein, partial [Planctomycetota bacterium]|nr:acylneuraminate cytidylyltransferase family protein [Planctomycetota bacterium]
MILARGGSKGIPKKNLLKIKGKPLLQYTIEASLASNVTDTWVSTDCAEIAEAALLAGANPFERPEEFATDTCKSEDALVHFCQKMKSDYVVFIQPTSPLLETKYINQGISMLNDYDSVFSAYKEHWIPRWTLDVKPHKWQIDHRPRRQDKPERYVENGAFYISSHQAILETKLRYSGNIGIVEMPYSKSF